MRTKIKNYLSFLANLISLIVIFLIIFNIILLVLALLAKKEDYPLEIFGYIEPAAAEFDPFSSNTSLFSDSPDSSDTEYPANLMADPELCLTKQDKYVKEVSNMRAQIAEKKAQIAEMEAHLQKLGQTEADDTKLIPIRRNIRKLKKQIKSGRVFIKNKVRCFVYNKDDDDED